MPTTKTLAVGFLAAGALALAACGSSGGDPAPVAAPPVEPPTTVAPPAPANVGSVSVTVRDLPLGRVLVGEDGLTLYGFTNDVNAESTCYGACAEAWPPVVVEPDWAVGPGLDSGGFSTVIREDGSEQLMAGKFPLYHYAGDGAPGEVNGQASGDVWFVMSSDAKLITGEVPPAAPAPTTVAPSAPVAPARDAPPSLTVAESGLGKIVVDADGNTLYGFTKDVNGTSTCTDACAKAWPPAVVDGTPFADGIDANLVTTVQRPDGSTQLKVGKWPVYRFAGDAQPGDTNGQGSGGVWFVIGADGKLIKS